MKKLLLSLSCVALFACTDEPVPVKVESVALNADVLNLTVEESKKLEVTVLPSDAENKTVYWSSSDNDVATVNDGVVIAVAPGEVTITVLSEDGGKKATCTVRVSPKLIPVTGITLDKENIRMFVGKESVLIATVTPDDASNKVVSWKSNDVSVATVVDGVVKAVGVGNTKIIAETQERGFKAECNVKVTEECQTQTKGPMTLDLGDVTATTAVLSGSLDIDLLADYDMSGGGVGFIYAPTAKELDIETATKVKISNVDAENSFSRTLTGLLYDTEYSYTIFLYKNGILQYGEVQKFKTSDVVIEVGKVATTTTTATFTGNLDLKIVDSEIEAGIMCSASSSFPTNSTQILSIRQSSYSLKFTDLDIDRKYYYRTYICQQGRYEYGETKDFTTKSVSVDLSVKSKTQTSVTLSGKVNPVDILNDVTMAVLLNTKETVDKNNYLKKITLTSDKIMSDGSFSVQLSGLEYNTTYYYTYYVLNNGKYEYGTIKNFSTEDVSVTLSVKNITQTKATFTGNISLEKISSIEVGLLYSTSSNPKATTSGVKKVVLTDALDSNGNFTYTASELQNETTYYYRYYVKQNSEYTYGTSSSFQTKNVTATLSVKDITQTCATISGSFSLTESKAIEVGVLYSTSSNPKATTSGVKKVVLTDALDSNGNFAYTVSELYIGTTYYYRYYVKQNGEYTYGTINSFETINGYIIQSDLSISSAVDLSSSVSANCYIVSMSGLYKFKTVQGNSSTFVGSVSSAEILWESFGTSTVPNKLDLIKAFCYKDGYIAFQTADTFKEGNAVIAAKDASGNILWSWHIWMTDQPQDQVYNNNAGTMMDRNLGATSATPSEVGALGLLYQWGRKDPFLGSLSIHYDYMAEAKSTITWPSAVSTGSNTGTVDYTVSHPTTFIYASSSPYDWHYSSRDNTLWTTSETSKSVYDPCPVGWRVPDGGSNGIWSKALGSSSSFTDLRLYDSTYEGMDFARKFGSASTIWYPASGCRHYRDGSLSSVGSSGNYWSASPYSNDAYRMFFSSYGVVYPSFNESRASGYSVRCLKESK